MMIKIMMIIMTVLIYDHDDSIATVGGFEKDALSFMIKMRGAVGGDFDDDIDQFTCCVDRGV